MTAPSVIFGNGNRTFWLKVATSGLKTMSTLGRSQVADDFDGDGNWETGWTVMVTWIWLRQTIGPAKLHSSPITGGSNNIINWP